MTERVPAVSDSRGSPSFVPDSACADTQVRVSPEDSLDLWDCGPDSAAYCVHRRRGGFWRESVSRSGRFSFQPTELVKLTFVFFVAARLAKSTEFKDVVLTTILAGLHVLVLVFSRDLGGALLFSSPI